MASNKDHLTQELQIPVAFTERETQILQMIATGKTSREIADELYISQNTVDTYRKRMIKKVHANNIFGVFHYTFRKGILNPEIFRDSYAL